MSNYNIQLIISRRSYSVNEIASLLNIHRKTCRRWIKCEGLEVIKENAKPSLIMGVDLINFIKKKRDKRRVSLKEEEFFCVRCLKAVKAKMGSESTIKMNKKIGRNDQEQSRKTGICESCGTRVNRFLGV